MAACTKSRVSCFMAEDSRVERSHTVQKVKYSKDPDADGRETPAPSGSRESLRQRQGGLKLGRVCVHTVTTKMSYCKEAIGMLQKMIKWQKHTASLTFPTHHFLQYIWGKAEDLLSISSSVTKWCHYECNLCFRRGTHKRLVSYENDYFWNF